MDLFLQIITKLVGYGVTIVIIGGFFRRRIWMFALAIAILAVEARLTVEPPDYKLLNLMLTAIIVFAAARLGPTRDQIGPRDNASGGDFFGGGD